MAGIFFLFTGPVIVPDTLSKNVWLFLDYRDVHIG